MHIFRKNPPPPFLPKDGACYNDKGKRLISGQIELHDEVVVCLIQEMLSCQNHDPG
jgi:hypothetical protein